jgi:uncharacterized protein
MHIGKKEKADIEILKYASLLHDIGRIEEMNSKGKKCHAELGAKMALKLLANSGLSDDKVQKIIHCISSHRFKGRTIPKTIEAKVLYDADKLDCIGAVGIGRSFQFSGDVGARLHNCNVDIKKTRSYSQEDTAYRVYKVKLRFVKDRLFTFEGRRLARSRHKFMIDFFIRMNREVEGKL